MYFSDVLLVYNGPIFGKNFISCTSPNSLLDELNSCTSVPYIEDVIIWKKYIWKNHSIIGNFSQYFTTKSVHNHFKYACIFSIVVFTPHNIKDNHIWTLNNCCCSNICLFFQQLSFPSLHNGFTSFNFSLSSTADMEGPGGSFECLQQTNLPQASLAVLGPIPYRMRILANDDVYEATRHRMTVAEENHKNKW